MKKKDYRKNQKVIATIILEDKGQDFPEIDVLENGVILGNSIMFENGKLSMIGVGDLNGFDYWPFNKIKEDLSYRPLASGPLTSFYIYFKKTNESEPLPWKANTLKYKIVGVKKTKKVNRFIN